MIKSQKIKNFLECVIGKECSKTIFFPDGSIFVEKDDILYPSDVNKLIKSKDDKDFLSITSFEFIKNNVSFVLGRDCLISERKNITVKPETVAALNDAKENDVKPLAESEKVLQGTINLKSSSNKKENVESASRKNEPKLIDQLNKKQRKYALGLYRYIKDEDLQSLQSTIIFSKRKNVKRKLKNQFSCKFVVEKGGRVKIYSSVIPCLRFKSRHKNDLVESLKGFSKVVISILEPIAEYISTCGLELVETNKKCESKGTQENVVISKTDFYAAISFGDSLLSKSKKCKKSMKEFKKRTKHLKLFKDIRCYSVSKAISGKKPGLYAEIPSLKCVVYSLDGSSLPSKLMEELKRIYENYKD